MGRKFSEENKKYRNIEKILRNIPRNRVRVKNMKLELDRIRNTYKGCGGFVFEERTSNTYKITSSVENEVVKKEEKEQALSRRIMELEIEIAKVDNSLTVLTKRELEIVDMLYFQHMRNKEVAQKLLYTEQYFCCIKNRILDKLIYYFYCGNEEAMLED